MYEQDATNTSGELKFNTLNLCKIFHENDMLHALSAAPCSYSAKENLIDV